MSKRDLWYLDRPNRCEVCGKKGFVQAGHVVKEQTLKANACQYGYEFSAVRWDTRNRMWLGVKCRCHERHTLGVKRIELAKIPESAFDFSVGLFGSGKAYNILKREFSGDDPRLDALLQEDVMEMGPVHGPATLRGGPFDGTKVVDRGSTYTISGGVVPVGFVARYKPKDKRKRSNPDYVFDGLSEVVGSLPLPGEESLASPPTK